MWYFDASALAKRYVHERGSAEVRRLLAADLPAVSRLSPVEIASALTRVTREGTLSTRSRDRALLAVERDLTAMLVVELTPEIVSQAVTLLRRYLLRAGDAIQLSSCLSLRQQLETDIVFVAFDERLLAAAREEGLTVAL